MDNILKWLTSNLSHLFNTLRPRQNGRHFADDIFKCIFLNENIWILIQISLEFVPKGPINNFPALVQIMACRQPGDNPLSELMMASLLTHICVTRLQWVNNLSSSIYWSYHVFCVTCRIVWLTFYSIQISIATWLDLCPLCLNKKEWWIVQIGNQCIEPVSVLNYP